jgi:VWFA-related protein
MPCSAQDTAEPNTVIRVQTSVVLVPTLVELKSGEIVYGLGPKDFELYDNGVKQQLRVDEEMDTAPVSVVVAIETGRSSALQFQRISRIASLLDLFLGDGKSDAALITFDSHAQLVQDFTSDPAKIDAGIRNLQPGDGGAAIYDATAFALNILQDRAPERRRVLLLISETRDHGSGEVKVDELVRKIGASNTLVVSLAFGAARSEYKAEFMDDLKHGNDGPGFNFLQAMMVAVNATRKNVAREIAVMSGGEYAPFSTERSFEDRIFAISRHARNRYLLSFHPSDPTGGLHTLNVKLVRNIDARVVTRVNYWSEAPAASH